MTDQTEKEKLEKARARIKKVAADYLEKGDAFGWFDAVYKEAGGDNEMIPWADLEPNEYFRSWVNKNGLYGEGKTAMVVGCGLGDDAKFLHDAGFKVTAFDISPTAIDWAKKIYGGYDIDFVTADLFDLPAEWRNAFDLVLEIYTIQPLPIEMRPNVMDAIAELVAFGGELIVVTRGREDDEEPLELPWEVSRRDLKRFLDNGLTQTDFEIFPSNEPEMPIPRFVVKYRR